MCGGLHESVTWKGVCGGGEGCWGEGGGLVSATWSSLPRKLPTLTIVFTPSARCCARALANVVILHTTLPSRGTQWQNVTSVFIHVGPMMLTYGLRWHPAPDFTICEDEPAYVRLPAGRGSWVLGEWVGVCCRHGCVNSVDPSLSVDCTPRQMCAGSALGNAVQRRVSLLPVVGGRLLRRVRRRCAHASSPAACAVLCAILVGVPVTCASSHVCTHALECCVCVHVGVRCVCKCVLLVASPMLFCNDAALGSYLQSRSYTTLYDRVAGNQMRFLLGKQVPLCARRCRVLHRPAPACVFRPPAQPPFPTLLCG